MADSKVKLCEEVCEYCSKVIISRAKAFVLRDRVACRVCYNRGGREPTCVECGKSISEKSTIHKFNGRVYCFRCHHGIRQATRLDKFLAKGGKIAVTCPCGGWIDESTPSLFLDNQRVCSSCATRGIVGEAATDRQIEFAKSLGLRFPSNIGKRSLSALIDAGIKERDLRSLELGSRPTGPIIELITKVARSHQLVAILYEKGGDEEPTIRIVEAYCVQRTQHHYLLRCWQVKPTPEDDNHWRTFRLNQIIEAREVGREFQPREPITLGTDDIRLFELH